MSNIFFQVRKHLKQFYIMYKLRNIALYYRSPSVPSKYPMDINLEITSYCNSKCKFCTHEELISSGTKTSKHMDFDFAVTAMRRLRDIIDYGGIDCDQVRFAPVGLGDPLLSPIFFDVISTARKLFPGAHLHANTNCIALKGRIADRLIGCDLDAIRFSLCFDTPEEYKEYCGVDKYHEVENNIVEFLRNKKNSKPDVTIHIFDINLDKKKYRNFVDKWMPVLNLNDNITVEKYIPLTDWSVKKGAKYPCNQLWNIMMVDVDGYVFPCCLGIWTKRNNDLCLGYISDSVESILNNLDKLRNRHILGNYGICERCSYLTFCSRDNEKFFNKIVRKGASGIL